MAKSDSHIEWIKIKIGLKLVAKNDILNENNFWCLNKKQETEF